MNDEMNLAKLSVLLNSAVRMNTSNKGVRGQTYKETMKILERSLPLCRTSSQQSKNPSEKPDEKEEKKPFKAFEKRETLSKSCDNKQIKTTVKKRMKWNDYLAIQVEKQRKINEELNKTLKSSLKKQEKPSPVKPQPVEKSKANEKIDFKKLEKDLDKFKPVSIKDNFKKLDEQEGFIEEFEDFKPESIKELEESEDKEGVKEKDDDEDEAKDEMDENEKRIQEIIQRYEKTIGKIKIESKPGTPSVMSVKISKVSQPRSKSAFSNYSTQSQKVAMDKLKELEEEEKRIKQQKEEILRILETRSQKRDASRPMTVSSLYSMQSEPKKNDQFVPVRVLPATLPSVKIERPKSRHSVKSSKRSDITNEVKELLSNLFD